MSTRKRKDRAPLVDVLIASDDELPLCLPPDGPGAHDDPRGAAEGAPTRAELGLLSAPAGTVVR
ncbi:hypothetical protein [Streptomyces sp. NPDC090025]|uniref:hypothetical protein n=1 Tax=Streptomyces sp. NPDC090025 TaxID=3365922 RepID=UPI003834C981